VLLLGLGAAVAIALPRLTRRTSLAVAATALVAALAAPAAYSLQTASVAHTGAIPSAGPAGASRSTRPGGRRTIGRPPGALAQGFAGPTGGVGSRGGLGGLLDTATPSGALVSLLRADASQYTWAAAAIGAESAAGVQLAADEPIMAIGGFNGTDPTPTLTQFKAYVAAGKIHYFLASGRGGSGGGPGAGSASASAISSWVEQTFTATTVGGVTVYDLTA
jgi:hypothetical protein